MTTSAATPPKPRILVADDDPDIRGIVVSTLALLGADICEVCDGSEALRVYQHSGCDVAVLDFTMPGLNGLEVCRAVKESPEGKYVPVLMLTARDGLKDKVEALDDGADDYLTKPFHYQELQARVRALLRVRTLNLNLREQNRQLEEMQQKLVQQERQLLAHQLAGTAAHRLGQPLAAITLNCHLVETLPAGDERIAKAIQAIRADVRRMADLIERLKSVDAQKTSAYVPGTDILDLER